MASEILTIIPEQAGTTLAALLRARSAGLSWKDARRRVETRHVKIGGEICLDPARRVKAGEVVEILSRPDPKPKAAQAIRIRYLDEHLVVVEKPSGISTVRHPVERDWSQRRKALSPTLEDLVPGLLAQQGGQQRKGRLPRLRIVQRLDKETSGLVVFARTPLAERVLGRQFRKHTVIRRYLAIIPGSLPSQRIVSRLIRNRGDGRRGSTILPNVGKEAITHVEVQEQAPQFALLSCRLETGRTHQIRIHLAELGHPVAGDKVYHRRPDGGVIPDKSRAPRLALHATELGIVHPVSGVALHWEMPLPDDLQGLWDRLRNWPVQSGERPAGSPKSKP